jgi:foldase protein PrsA
MRTSILTILLLLTAATVAAQDAKPRRPLPPNAVGMVHGKAITMDRFRAALLRRFGTTEDGRAILENLAVDLLVAAEAKRRGVEVTDEEVEAYVNRTAAQVKARSGGKKTLDDFIRERGVTRKDFLEIARRFVLRQKLAAQDYRTDGEVSGARLGVWIEELKKKGGIEYGPKGLPEGAWARVGGRVVTSEQFGEALVKSLAPNRLESVAWDLAITEAIDQKLAEWKIEITAADIDRELRGLEEEFRKDPRFKGLKVTFAQWVSTVKQMTIPELRKDPSFRAQVGLGKKIRLDLTEDDVRKYFEENAEKYGEKRSFIHLLVKGESKASPFGKASRPLPEAKRIIEGYKKQYLAGAPFLELVKKHSETRTQRIKPEDPITISRRSVGPQALRDVVFGAAVGDVIGPIKTSYGYHLVQVLKVIPAPGYQKVRDEVAADLAKTKRRSAILAIRQDPAIVLRY